MTYRLGCLRKNNQKFDPQQVLDAVSFIYETPPAQILSPIRSDAQDAYLFNLYKFTELRVEDICEIYQVTSQKIIRAIYLYAKQINPLYPASLSEPLKFKQEDIRQYLRVFRSKSRIPIKINNKRFMVESEGIDYLEFIRRPLKEQKEWYKERIPDYGVRKKRNWSWSPEFDEDGNLIEKN